MRTYSSTPTTVAGVGVRPSGHLASDLATVVVVEGTVLVTGSLVDVVDAGGEVDETAASSDDDPHAATTSEMVKTLTMSLVGRFAVLIISFPLSFGPDAAIIPPLYVLIPHARLRVQNFRGSYTHGLALHNDDYGRFVSRDSRETLVPPSAAPPSKRRPGGAFQTNYVRPTAAWSRLSGIDS